jgi:hypothetical protein
MTIQIELSPESEARLVAEAQARGVPLETYAGSLLQQILASPVHSSGNLTIEKFHAMLDALAKGSERLPDLPTESFTRETFYEDRT